MLGKINYLFRQEKNTHFYDEGKYILRIFKDYFYLKLSNYKKHAYWSVKLLYLRSTQSRFVVSIFALKDQFN